MVNTQVLGRVKKHSGHEPYGRLYVPITLLSVCKRHLSLAATFDFFSQANTCLLGASVSILPSCLLSHSLTDQIGYTTRLTRDSLRT